MDFKNMNIKDIKELIENFKQMKDELGFPDIIKSFQKDYYNLHGYATEVWDAFSEGESLGAALRFGVFMDSFEAFSVKYREFLGFNLPDE